MAPAALVEDAPERFGPSYAKASTVRASVLHGPRDLRLEVRPLEDPGVGEVQVAVRATGICGSDVAYYTKFANGDLCACMPLSLGHESSGVVVALGPQVAGLRVGDRVALEVGVPCARCALCRRGRYNLCKRMRFRSSAKSVPHYQGTLQERINHPARWCHKLPDHVSFDAAALLEPLSVAIHAVNRAALLPGSSALVLGAGTVGLLTAAVARNAGCAQVTITDVDPGRVRYALAHGFATHGCVAPRPGAAGPAAAASAAPPADAGSGLHTSASSTSISTAGESCSSSDAGSCASSDGGSGASTPASTASTVSVASVASVVSDAAAAAAPLSFAAQLAHAQNLARDLQALAAPPPDPFEADADADADPADADDEFDVAFECTGKEVCMHTALYATRPGGKSLMVGMGTPVQTLPLSVAHLREIDILGIFRYANTYAAGLRMLASGRLPPLDAMVTHRFRGLAAAPAAFELARRTVDDDGRLVLKVVIEAN